MRKEEWVVLMVLLAGMAWAQCIPAEAGMVLRNDTLLCPGTVDLAAPITAAGDGIVVRCDGTLLRGSGTGMIVEGDDVQVQECAFDGFGIGIEVRGSGFSEVGTSYSGVENARSLAVKETLSLPGQGNGTQVGPEGPVPPQPSAPPAVPSTVTTPNGTQTKPNASIWEVADIKSEKLLENALRYEYDTTSVPEAVVAGRVALLQQTFKDLVIERKFVYVGGTTQVVISIRPEHGFFRKVIYENITLYEYIPKCFAQLVDEVVFEGEQPVVLEKDPLLKKVILKDEPLRFSYSAAKAISPRCQELFRIIGVGMGRQELTLGSVWREKGVVQVLKEFPVETVALIIFIALVSFGGVWYKRQIHGAGR